MTGPLLGVLVGVPLFAAWWLAITSLLLWVTGWRRLAAAFPGGPRPGGEVLRGQVYGFGRVNENNVTNVITARDGLYLFPMFLFRFRRPPVLVPWDRVRYLESGRQLWVRWHRVELGGTARVRVSTRLLRELRAHGVRVPADLVT